MTDLDTDPDEPDASPIAFDEPEPGEIDECVKMADQALLEQDSLSSRRLLGRLFERELDILHTPRGSSFFSDRRENRSVEDEAKRDERMLMAAVTEHARRSLRSHGINIVRTRLDGETEGGGGYIVHARDAGGRPYEARFGLELAEKLIAKGGHAGLVERMGQAVAREVLGAREKYFARMQ